MEIHNRREMDKNALPVEFKGNTYLLSVGEAKDFESLTNWFASEFKFKEWAGPSVPFTQNPETLQQSLESKGYQSIAIRNQKQQLIAFGQYQLGRTNAHLGRLCVHPKLRGKGLSYLLINSMMDYIVERQPVDFFTLFVYSTNKAAIAAYQNLGFISRPWPSSIPEIDGCQFMLMRY